MKSDSAKLEAKDLFIIFDDVRRSSSVFGSNSKTVSMSIKHPTTVAIYKTIKQFSKEDLESVKNKWGESLWEVALDVGNMLLIIPFLECESFKSKYNTEVNWCLSKITKEKRDIEFYELLTNLLLNKSVDEKISTRDEFFEQIIRFTGTLETDNQNYLLDEFFKDFKGSFKQFFLENLTNEWVLGKDKKKLIEKIFSMYEADGIFLKEEGNPFDNFLTDKRDSFVISLSLSKKFKDLIDLGFKFENKTYRYEDGGAKSLLAHAISNVIEKQTKFDLEVFGLVLNNVKTVNPIDFKMKENQEKLMGSLQSLIEKGHFYLHLTSLSKSDESKYLEMFDDYKKKIDYEDLQASIGTMCENRSVAKSKI